MGYSGYKEIMHRYFSLIILLLVAVFCLPGCQRGYQVQKNWGRSYESAKYLQILHPEAGGARVVEGLDGQAAEQIYQQYLKSFSEKEPSTTLGTILIGND